MPSFQMNTNATNVTLSACKFNDSTHAAYVQSTADLVEYSLSLAVLILVWNLLLPVLTIAGNLTVISIVLLNHQLRRVPSNMIIASLAFADLITGAVLQSNHAMGVYDALTRKTINCYLIYSKFVEAVGIVTITASVANLATITFDRYIAIVHALRYTSIVTFWRTVYALLLAWTFSLVFGISLSVLSTLYVDIYSKLRLLWYTYMVSACLIIAVLYVKLHHISKCHTRKILADRSRSERHLLPERRGLATISMVMIALVISFIPYTTIRSIMRMKSTTSKFLNVARMLSFTFLLSNAMVNPLVYFFRSRNLRSFSYKMFLSSVKRVQKRCS